MKCILVLSGLIAASLFTLGEAGPYYLFPGAIPYTNYYGNVGGEPALPYGGYGVGEGFPYYPLGYGGYGNGRSYAVETKVPGGVFGFDGCGCDGYGKYGCNC